MRDMIAWGHAEAQAMTMPVKGLRSERFDYLHAHLILGNTMQDGYTVDKHGVHHRVLDAVLETEPGKDCYGWIDVYSNYLDLVGVGDLQSQKMPFGEAASAVSGQQAHADDTVQAEDATRDRQPQ